jgi:serine protease Do
MHSPADEAGLLVGDVITEIDGHVVRRADDLMWLVATTPAGRRVKLSVVRMGKPLSVSVVLESSFDEKPDMPPVAAESAHKSPLGITVSEISPDVARRSRNAAGQGVVVNSVEPDSPAVEAGIERGDLVLRVGELPIATLDDYAKAVRALGHGDMLRMLVRRDGRNLWVAFPKR